MSRVTVITGGVGGAKLVLGLVDLLGPGAVTAIVNTGDDFVHLGLAISPDIDTLLYTLSGRANRELGWGRHDETWSFMAAVASLGGEDWFRLGDGDLALHVLRTRALAGGQSLSAFTAGVVRAWNIGAEVLPMSDQAVSTMVETRKEGVLSFQRYFVGRRCVPEVAAIRFDGASSAQPGPGVIEAILDPDVRAIVIAPSNPMLSVDPVLAVPGIREALTATQAPVVAVSPLIGGKAVKGPTAKLMAELGVPATSAAIAAHYHGILDGLVIDIGDVGDEALPVAASSTDTFMQTLADKRRVADCVLRLADRLRA